MDILSHVLLSFILGQALQLDTNAQIILVISSVALDIDAVSIPGRGTWFQFHRGSIHSVPAAILVSLLIGTAYAVFLRLQATALIFAVLICAGGLFSHIFLDLLTSGSIAVLWPFSIKRFTLSLTYSVDPIFFGVLLLTSVLIFGLRNDMNVIRIVVILAMVLLFAYFGVRRYERDAAIRTIKALNADADSKFMSSPTMRPDRWWIGRKIQFGNGYRYEIYSVDSIRRKTLSNSNVESPYLDYHGPAEPPLDSPEKAVAYSKRDKRIGATIERFCLTAVEVGLSEDGNTWQVFWYDAFTRISKGEPRGVTVNVGVDGTVTLNGCLDPSVSAQPKDVT